MYSYAETARPPLLRPGSGCRDASAFALGGRLMVGPGNSLTSSSSWAEPFQGGGWHDQIQFHGGMDHSLSHRLDALEREVERCKRATLPPIHRNPSTGQLIGPGMTSGMASHMMPMPMQWHSAHYAATPPMPAASGPAAGTVAAQSGDGAGLVAVSGGVAGPTAEHVKLMGLHKDLLQKLGKQREASQSLMKAHMELLQEHTKRLEKKQKLAQAAVVSKKAQKKKHPTLGVIRLDYDYPPALGDIDHPASYGYNVIFRVIPGFTFEMAQKGQFDERVERDFAEGIKFLEQKGVHAITGDCGFMMAFQVLARKIASAPVFMSSMCQCPLIAAAFEESDQIMIMTANDVSLGPQKDVLLETCGFNVNAKRFVIVGCQDVPGFDAVAKGEAVPLEEVQPGIVKLALKTLENNPSIASILLECTELPPYADALRAATCLPVWDAVTAADFYVSAYKDNPRVGIGGWQEKWNNKPEDYRFGQNLIDEDRARLKFAASGTQSRNITRMKTKPIDISMPDLPPFMGIEQEAPFTDPTHPLSTASKEKRKVQRVLKKLAAPSLGVLCLDYDKNAQLGDVDCEGSFGYQVIFRRVKGLTYQIAKSGSLPEAVRKEFATAIKWLENQGVHGITSDCGFMMCFQILGREVAKVPIFLSAMIQSPMISVAFDKYDKILILTGNKEAMMPMKNVFLKHCGFDVDDYRFLIHGCDTVPKWNEVNEGKMMDIPAVKPGLVSMVQEIIFKQPTIRAICSESALLPAFSDALRDATGLPVFDVITLSDFFISARKDNPRFGLNGWQE